MSHSALKGDPVPAPLAAGAELLTAPASMSLGHLLDRVGHRVSCSVERVLGPTGLGLDQWRVLELLADGEGHPMTEIAVHVMVPPPTLTKIVNRLVASALVYRLSDEIDRRRVLVFLSDHGRTQHRELAPQIAKAECDVADGWTGVEYAHLTQLLQRLAR